MADFLQSLFAAGFSLLTLFITIIMAVVIGLTMTVKGRNGLLWAIAGLFFPWLIFIVFFIPAKVPKLPLYIRNHEAFKGLNPAIASMMALSAMVAKIDGRIKKEEIQLIRRFVQKQFALTTLEINTYEGAFNYGKTHLEDHQVFAEYLSRYCRYNTKIAMTYLFVGIAVQDGHISAQEEQLLRRIVAGLSLNEYIYLSIKNHYQGGYSNFSGRRSSYGHSSPDMTREQKIKKYSEVLGVSVDADMATIKKAYRKLAKENHPDTLAQAGMPDDYMEYANKRISEINEAYDYLKDLKAA